VEEPLGTSPVEPRSPAVLNLGAGRRRIPGAINVDICRDVGADVVHDLNCTPWPLPSDHFSEVHAQDVLEHLDDLVKAMEEIHRVCRPGAVVHITVPHFSSANAFTDITHRHYFSWSSFECFDAGHDLSYRSSARFRRQAARIFFHSRPVNRIVRRLANRYPGEYERHWAWIFPAWFLGFRLEAVK
jgi:SAM-dependent methyltransferase